MIVELPEGNHQLASPAESLLRKLFVAHMEVWPEFDAGLAAKGASQAAIMKMFRGWSAENSESLAQNRLARWT